MIPKINSAHGSDTRNIINRVIEVLNQQGKSIQDLVAEGQLTEEQYAELITTINGMVKSGEVDKTALTPELRYEINLLRDKIDKGDVSINDLRPDVLSAINREVDKDDLSQGLRTEINQLRNKIDTGDVSLNDLLPEVLQAINNSDGTPFNILSIPRKKSVTHDKTTFLKVVSDNLYDGELNRDKSIDTSTGEIIDNTNNFGVTGFIPVEENTTYTKNDTMETGKGYYRDDFSFISWEKVGSTFTTPPETAYVVIVIHQGNLYQWRLNLGSESLPYDEYKVEMTGLNVTYNMFDEETKSIIDNQEGSQSSQRKNAFYLQDTVPYGWYEAPLIEGYGDGTNGHNVNSGHIYSFLDKLVDDDYVTSEILGKDESGTLDIKRYDFKPEMMNINNLWGRDEQEVENLSLKKEYPKIIIHSGTHGEEKAAPVALAHFLDDLTRNWQSDPLLEFIRFNVHLIVVPVTNPYGYDVHDKVNVNGVDINRNFDFEWNEHGSDDPADNFYRGTAPHSEVESQYIRDIILENPDAMAFYDFHMNGSSGDEWRRSYWTVLKEFYDKYGYEQMQVIAASDINKITREAHERYNVPLDSGFLGMVTYDNPSTSTSYAFDLGIPSATIECTKALVGESWYSYESMQLNAEYIGNKILTTVRSFEMY